MVSTLVLIRYSWVGSSFFLRDSRMNHERFYYDMRMALPDTIGTFRLVQLPSSVQRAWPQPTLVRKQRIPVSKTANLAVVLAPASSLSERRHSIGGVFAQIKNRLPEPLPLGGDHCLAPVVDACDGALDCALSQLHTESHRCHPSPSGLHASNRNGVDGSLLGCPRVECTLCRLKEIHDLSQACHQVEKVLSWR